MKINQYLSTSLVMATLAFNMNTSFASANITGAGATFPAPIYATWADNYYKETGNKINYQGIGSSGGVKQIIAGTVDFGASDAPLTDEQLKKDNLFQFPTVIGGIVMAVNVKGIKSNELVLDGKTLGDIYLGTITKWNDPAIAKLNPTLTLPAQNIAVVRRADGSGTTFVFSGYLSKVNEKWKTDIGSGSTVNWPTGIAGKGNDGVAAFVQRIPGSIGYVEYAYAKKNGLSFTKMVSADGQTVSPSAQSFSNAALGVDWKSSFAQDLTNKAGNETWPITSTTFVLIHKQQKNAANGTEVLKFFDWTYKNGSQQALTLDYATLPESVVEQIRESWRQEIKDSANNSLYK